MATLAGVANYWAADNQGAIIGVNALAGKDFVKRNLGITAVQARNAASLDALKDPSAKLAAYHNALNAQVDIAGEQWAKDVALLLLKGLPKEKAEQIALGWASQDINKSKQILALDFPLMENMDLLATAEAGAGTQIHLGSADKLEKYDKYKAAYKAKKAKKRAKAQK
jgi:hypothetical protein